VSPITCYRDPGISAGPFRILPFAPGGFLVYDDRREPGDRTVGRSGTAAGAAALARELLANENRMAAE